MLEYMAIMFAAAFLLVAISLLIKVIDMKGEMEAANTGARGEHRAAAEGSGRRPRRVRRAADQARRGQHRVLRGSRQALGGETRLSEAEKARRDAREDA